MEQRNSESENREWPAWGALLLAVGVAAGVSALLLAGVIPWQYRLIRAHGGDISRVLSGYLFAIIALAFGCFSGTYAFAAFAPSRRWDVGFWLGGGLLTAVFALEALAASSGFPPNGGEFGASVALTLAACYSGLALAPLRSRTVLRHALLAIIATVVAVVLVIWRNAHA